MNRFLLIVCLVFLAVAAGMFYSISILSHALSTCHHAFIIIISITYTNENIVLVIFYHLIKWSYFPFPLLSSLLSQLFSHIGYQVRHARKEPPSVWSLIWTKRLILFPETKFWRRYRSSTFQFMITNYLWQFSLFPSSDGTIRSFIQTRKSGIHFNECETFVTKSGGIRCHWLSRGFFW